MISTLRRTKIVCTLGPSSSEVSQISDLIKNGMNVARINFSHSNHATHQQVIENVHQAARAQRRVVPILADLQGPKIRVGTMKDDGQDVFEGDYVELVSDENIEGTSERIPIDYDQLAHDAAIGDKILIDDGLLELQVVSKNQSSVKAKVIAGGTIKSRKGVNLPGVKISMAALTPKDIDDLEFAISQQVDYVAMSFVRTADDIQEVTSRIRALDSPAGIIAKIEKPEAVENFDEIIEEADGIMVARGDLGIEIASEQVPLVQKRIIDESQRAGKPVITATQMLDSMIQNPRATRAENSDVANAVLDGTDAVMLSGETAIGRYPGRAVHAMDKICRSIESHTHRIYNSLPFKKPEWREKQVVESLSFSCVTLAKNINARLIATLTHSGTTAHKIAKFRPQMPIVAFTESEQVCKQLELVWGIEPIKIGAVYDTDKSVRLMEQKLQDLQMVTRGDRVIITTGMPIAKRGRTNMIKVSTIS